MFVLIIYLYAGVTVSLLTIGSLDALSKLGDKDALAQLRDFKIVGTMIVLLWPVAPVLWLLHSDKKFSDAPR